MSNDSRDLRSERLNQVIAEFIEAVASGEEPDRNELIRQHPDLADNLRSFLADHDQMKAAREGIEDPTLPPWPPGSDEANRQGTQVGTTVRYFGDYELLEEIARGGMGVIYKARQINLNRTVALKMILAGQPAAYHASPKRLPKSMRPLSEFKDL